MTYAQLQRYIADLSASGVNVVPQTVALYRKISFPFVTLIMTLIAVPFAVTTGRRGALYGIAVGIVARRRVLDHDQRIQRDRQRRHDARHARGLGAESDLRRRRGLSAADRATVTAALTVAQSHRRSRALTLRQRSDPHARLPNPARCSPCRRRTGARRRRRGPAAASARRRRASARRIGNTDLPRRRRQRSTERCHRAPSRTAEPARRRASARRCGRERHAVGAAEEVRRQRHGDRGVLAGAAHRRPVATKAYAPC